MYVCMCIYIYIYTFIISSSNDNGIVSVVTSISTITIFNAPSSWILGRRVFVVLYILQRGVQWKQGVVICMVLYIILLCNTTPIHCTPLPLHPPLQSIHVRTLWILLTTEAVVAGAVIAKSCFSYTFGKT